MRDLADEVETAVHGERQEDGQHDRHEQAARRAAVDLDAATLELLRLEHMQVVPAVDFVTPRRLRGDEVPVIHEHWPRRPCSWQLTA